MKVLLSVGTHEQPFARMVDVADRLAAAGHDVTIQYGYSRAPELARGFAFASGDELIAAMAGADEVVTHAGPATVLQALDVGRQPIVFPRSRAHGEHVDEHQVEFAAHLGAKGLARVAFTPDDVVGLIGAPQGGLDLEERRKRIAGNRLRLAASLDAWLLRRGS